MKKVLLTGNSDIVIYNFRKEIIERLLEEKYEVYILLPFGKKVDLLTPMGCHFIDLPIDRRGTNVFADFSLFIRYYKILKSVKPDVVLTYTIKPNIYGSSVCRLLNIPYICNITGLGTAVENKGILQVITVFLYRIALKNVSCVFFQNAENQQFFVDRSIACSKHRLIPGSGVNLKHFHVLKYPPDSTIGFIFISRIMKEKGIEQYLEAAEYIRNHYPNTRFYICGFCEEKYEERLKNLQEKGIIQYHGMLHDVREGIENTHCTVHPSYYPEGLSNVLLESAACGRPLITTDRSGCRQVVEDEVSGYLIKQRSSQDLIEKIERFLKLDYEEKKQMGMAGRKKVEREFDRQIVVDAYIEEIRKII